MDKLSHSSYGGVSGAVEAHTMNAFIESPFMQWLKTFPEAPAELSFEALTSSHFLFNILQEFDVNFSPKSTPPSLANLSHIEASKSSGGGDRARHPLNTGIFRAKVSYIECVIEGVKSFYENFLHQTLVVKLPDALLICNEPPTKESLREMDTLVWLMLGAAVQCSQRVAIVEAIKTLPVEVQEEIAMKIKEVRNNPEWVWTEDISRPDSGELHSQEQVNQHYLLLVNHLRNLVQQRDEFAHMMISANLYKSKHSIDKQKVDVASNGSAGTSTFNAISDSTITPESNHIALELSELKAQIRKLKQQLDERTETSRECKEEMEKYISKCSKLRQENLDLTQKAREARALRDELDIQRERAQKVHLLETEIQVYKDKISQTESLKSRMEEIREENKILVETKDMLEDQLQVSRKRCQQIIGLENELYICKSELGNCQMELESVKNSNIQLTEENSALQMSSKNSMSESQSLMAEMQMIKDTGRDVVSNLIKTCSSDSISAPFSICTLVERGNNDTNIMTEQLSKDTARMHRLELENQRLKSDIEDLKLNGIKEQSEKCLKLERENKCQALTIKQLQVFELEQENRKLSQSCSIDKKTLIQLRHELVEEKIKFDNLSSDMDILQKRLQKIGIDVNSLEDDQNELQSHDRVKNLEGSMNKLLETRQRRIEMQDTQLKEMKEKNISLQQQLDLLQLKVHTGDAKSEMEAQLSSVLKEREQLRTEILNIKMETNSNVKKIDLYENKLKKLQEENVQIQVENSTLQSQSTSLLSQINSLQTANVTLETAKRRLDEAEKNWNNERTELLQDQAGLQKLHNNLQQDYDSLFQEKEAQKETERALRSDLRKLQSMSVSLSEDQDNLLRAKEAIDLERENLKTDARTLANLRSEHARLKDDFRSLFTANERVKNEYCNLQTEYKALKTSYNQQKLQQTELKGELGDVKEQMTIIDVEHTKALNRCEVLAQLNMSLEDDRKSLMSQVSLLLSQYHDLLTQTMEDKEHFHEEEKYYSDRMNNLSRQKEKLEEKIMEQYKRMENSTPKKIGLGGQIVRKMKKASSNLISTGNRSRTSGNYRSQTSNGIENLPHQQHGISSSNSMENNFRSDTISNEYLNNNRISHHSTALELDSCSSLNGNDLDSCNDSSEGTVDQSGGRSPSPLVDRLSVGIHDLMSKSESEGQDFSKRKTTSNLQLSTSTSFSSSAQNSMANPGSHNFHSPNLSGLSHNLNPAFRRSMPPHLEDSDGNNADDDSVNSFNVSGGRPQRSSQTGIRDYSDDIPTRDIGPDRLIGHGSNHSEIGLPISAANDNRSRYVSRVSINGKDLSGINNLPGGNDYRITNTVHHPSALRYQPSSWKNNSGASSGASTGVSPTHSSNEDHNGDERNTPPTIPARKQSRAGQIGSDSNSGPPPPQRPPKPGRTRPNPSLQSPDNNISAGYSQDDTSSTNTIDDDENKKIDSNKLKENAEWYEYGCV